MEHTKDDGLSELLPQKALSLMSSEEMKEKPLEHTAPSDNRSSEKGGNGDSWPEY